MYRDKVGFDTNLKGPRKRSEEEGNLYNSVNEKGRREKTLQTKKRDRRDR
jgi:hypothetical protein